MTQVVILGISGEPGLWQADLKAGTITAIQEPLSGELANASSLRASGVTITKGVDFAIAASADITGVHGVHEGDG